MPLRLANISIVKDEVLERDQQGYQHAISAVFRPLEGVKSFKWTKDGVDFQGV
jgi:hypothetical protein